MSNKNHLVKAIIFLFVIATGSIVFFIIYKNGEISQRTLFERNRNYYVDQLKQETINSFNYNRKKFKVIKDFAISKINESSDQDCLLINLEESDYEIITDDEKIKDAFKFISRDLKYVEIYILRVSDKHVDISFVRQHGSEFEAEYSINYCNSGLKNLYNTDNSLIKLDDNWYFHCWAGD